jgi:hypothetical protein
MGMWDRQRPSTGGKAPMAITTKTPSRTPNTALRYVAYKDGNVLYACLAPAGTELETAAWQIRKIDTSTLAITILWCDGDTKFDNTATSLAVVQAHKYS